MSPRDQLVNVDYGNDAVDTWQYGPANGQMSAMMSAIPGLPDLLADLAYDYDEVGNLVLQTNYLTNVEEQFDYDQLHRITSSIIGPMSATTPIDPEPDRSFAPDPQPAPFITPEGVNYNYDALGNIKTKSDYADSYQYDNMRHLICASGSDNNLAQPPGPHAVTQVSAQIRSKFDGTITQQDYRMAYDANGNLICSQDGNLTVRYDAFNLPTHIQRGFVTQNFNYGPDLQRYWQDSSGTETLYIDKLYERKGSIERYYLGGYLVIERDSAGIDTHSYTHKDRLGSTVAITDDAGDIKVQQGFGPFGKARDEFWEAQDALPGKAYDSRGFTDHEHLDNTRLIHMNGRAYDYNLGRFLSVDPIIQFPSNSQSLNPYSYLMNNPMAGTDPTGYAGVSCTGTRILRANCDSFNPTTLSSSSATDEGNDSSSTRFRLLSAQAAARQNGASDSEGTTDSDGSGRLTNNGGPNDTGAPRGRAWQNTFTPNAQGDGVGCSLPLQCAGSGVKFANEAGTETFENSQDLTISEFGFNFIKSFEGRNGEPLLEPEQDTKRGFQIGFGRFRKKLAVLPSSITVDQALQFLREDIAIKAAAVNSMVTVNLNQNQFDAVVSLVFNVGQTAFARTRALSALNQGNLETFVIEAFDAKIGIVNADGMVSPGLVDRRRMERLLFQRPIQAEE